MSQQLTKNQIVKMSPEAIKGLTFDQIKHLIKEGKTFDETVSYFLYLQSTSKHSGDKPGNQIVSSQTVPEKEKVEKKVEKTTIKTEVGEIKEYEEYLKTGLSKFSLTERLDIEKLIEVSKKLDKAKKALWKSKNENKKK